METRQAIDPQCLWSAQRAAFDMALVSPVVRGLRQYEMRAGFRCAKLFASHACQCSLLGVVYFEMS